MFTPEMLALLQPPTAQDDKYSRGVVGFRTGSVEYPGAAILGVTAAMRTGVGMIRYWGPSEVSNLLLEVRPEVVCGEGKVQAAVLGSGVPTDGSQADAIRAYEQGDELLVLDAGALALIDFGALAPATAVLTPHAGEMARLLDRLGISIEFDYEAAQRVALALGQFVLLKGSTTFIASPFGQVVSVGPNPAALATAGTGDVLAGILGALFAHNRAALADDEAMMTAIELGVLLHSAAADLASQDGPVAALDVAEAVRTVVRDAQEESHA
jgi:hydroxyethylthiazole kinase-like uncharacterized protein yjeF